MPSDAILIVVPPDSAGLLFDNSVLVRPAATGEPDWRWKCVRCGGPRRMLWDDRTTEADAAAGNRRYRLGDPTTCGQCGSTTRPRRVT